MENFPDKDISAILESIIADKNATPEKQKWAENLLLRFWEFMASNDKMFECLKLIETTDPDSRETLLQERDDLFYKIAYQNYNLLVALNPAKEAIYRNEFEKAVRQYNSIQSAN